MSDDLDANGLVVGATVALVGSLVLLLQLLTAASLLPPLWLAGLPIVGFSLLLGVVFVVDWLSTATPTEDERNDSLRIVYHAVVRAES